MHISCCLKLWTPEPGSALCVLPLGPHGPRVRGQWMRLGPLRSSADLPVVVSQSATVPSAPHDSSKLSSCNGFQAMLEAANRREIYLGSKKVKSGEVCWQFWTWILGVNLGGGGAWKFNPWREKAEKRGKVRWEIRRQFSQNSPDQNKNFTQIRSAKPSISTNSAPSRRESLNDSANKFFWPPNSNLHTLSGGSPAFAQASLCAFLLRKRAFNKFGGFWGLSPGISRDDRQKRKLLWNLRAFGESFRTSPKAMACDQQLSISAWSHKELKIRCPEKGPLRTSGRTSAHPSEKFWLPELSELLGQIRIATISNRNDLRSQSTRNLSQIRL